MSLLPFCDLTEDELVASARAGREEAWTELVRRHHPPLLRYLSAAAGDAEEAAHLAQETFLDAVRSLGSLAPGQPFRPWLYRIARNNVLPYWRHRDRIRFTSLEDIPGSDRAALSSPYDLAEQVAERDALRQVLDDLSPLLREALLLHALAGLSAPEVAAATGVGQKAAEQRIGRAKAQFRVRYKALTEMQDDTPWRGDAYRQTRK
jgi:RNA polymerase sigma-70 factor (ECF subfamily)